MNFGDRLPIKRLSLQPLIREAQAEIKRQNEIVKTRIDFEVKELRERRDTVSVLMGKILEDMSKTSREKIEKYRMERPEGEAGATTLEEACIMGDWLYIFEAARLTHIYMVEAMKTAF